MALKGVSLPAVMFAAGGALFVWSGLKGASITASLRSLIGGQNPSGANANPITSGVAAGSGGGTGAAGSGGGSAGGGGGASAPAAPVSVSGNVALGRTMAAARGWIGAEWNALYALWQRESGWSNTAKNGSSGAYGIPQALPPTKMPGPAQESGGSHASFQIAWGLSYIAGRYGKPSVAWAHEESNGWY